MSDVLKVADATFQHRECNVKLHFVNPMTINRAVRQMISLISFGITTTEHNFPALFPGMPGSCGHEKIVLNGTVYWSEKRAASSLAHTLDQAFLRSATRMRISVNRGISAPARARTPSTMNLWVQSREMSSMAMAPTKNISKVMTPEAAPTSLDT